MAKGKGAFTYREEAKGAKCMPKGHMPKSSSHRMSSEHGTNSHNSTKGLINADGRVGAGTRAFKSNLNHTAGKGHK